MRTFPFLHDKSVLGFAPPGSIISYAGIIQDKPSDSSLNILIEKWGWMVCDGRQLSIAQYPILFEMIGFLYMQKGEKKSTKGKVFRIPDYRGYFLRMVDPTGQIDPDNSQRILLSGTKNAGVGSLQEDALQNHVHIYAKPNQGIPGKTGKAFAATKQAWTGTPTTNNEMAPGNVKVSKFESRPVNMAVYYIIKFV